MVQDDRVRKRLFSGNSFSPSVTSDLKESALEDWCCYRCLMPSWRNFCIYNFYTLYFSSVSPRITLYPLIYTMGFF